MGFNLSWHERKRALCEMEITTAYPCHAKPICWISIGFDRGRFVISPKRDVTASHPDSYTVGAKTQCVLVRNRFPPRFIFIHSGCQKQTLVGKYSVYARLPSYPQPTNVAVM